MSEPIIDPDDLERSAAALGALRRRRPPVPADRLRVVVEPDPRDPAHVAAARLFTAEWNAKAARGGLDGDRIAKQAEETAAKLREEAKHVRA